MTVVFTRSDSGLGNMHIFKDVSIIIYTEGADKDKNSGLVRHSQDIAFWKKIFEKQKFNANFKYEFKCAGSKPSVIDIANRICSNEIANVVAIMDSDHDRHRGKCIDSPFVLYTYGYSWENDLWTPGLILKVIEESFGANELPADIEVEVEQLFSDFKRNMRRFIRCHVICNVVEIKCIPNTWGQFITTSHNGMPKLSKSEIVKALRAVRERRQCKLVGAASLSVDPWRDCYGKLWQNFSSAVLNWLFTRRLAISRSLPKEVAVTLAMAQMGNVNLFQLDRDMCRYYDSVFLKFRSTLGV